MLLPNREFSSADRVLHAGLFELTQRIFEANSICVFLRNALTFRFRS